MCSLKNLYNCQAFAVFSASSYHRQGCICRFFSCKGNLFLFFNTEDEHTMQLISRTGTSKRRQNIECEIKVGSKFLYLDQKQSHSTNRDHKDLQIYCALNETEKNRYAMWLTSCWIVFYTQIGTSKCVSMWSSGSNSSHKRYYQKLRKVSIFIIPAEK